MAGRKEFLTALEKAKAENPRKIIIDLRDVTFVDSAGVCMLLVTQKELESSAISLTLCCSDGYAKKILELLNLHELMTFVSSTDF